MVPTLFSIGPLDLMKNLFYQKPKTQTDQAKKYDYSLAIG